MVARRSAHDDSLRVRLWGTRGSTNASGPHFAEFGGHTPCVEVRCGDRLFVLDAGSGISALGNELGAAVPSEIDILFSHVHLDHIAGLPFFKPAVLNPGRVIRTHCGNLDGRSAAEAADRLFSPPLFPISLSDLPARFEHHGFKAGETLHFPDGTRVQTHPLIHPGGATGYRFEHRGRVFCYITDMEHTDPWPDVGLVRFIRDADLMVYDGMFSDAEYSRCRGWGHSTWEKGIELCRAAGVKSLAIFHHYPGHDDATLRGIEAEIQAVMPSACIGRERQSFTFAPLDQRTAAAAEPAAV
jgi:phosphoribosyl 1,2-cyclic phosphodiesterase